MCHHLLSDPSFYIYLFDIDQDIANSVQADGCSCGGMLHSARYPRNRRGTSLKLLCYDGQGFWLCHKRLSKGRLKWWPSTPQASISLSHRELQILLWNGNPKAVDLVDDWRRVA